MPPSSLRPIIISGPSGCGKSTLLRKLFDEHPGRFGFSISHTTRKPRPGESNGREYHFVERSEFEDLVKKNAFLEHAQFSGNYYGTSAKAVQEVGEKGQQCILDIDSQGVKLVKADHPYLNAAFVFLSPPSIATLRQRLTGRGTETGDSIQARLAASKAEIEYARQSGNYDMIIVNDDLERAYSKLKKATVDGQYDDSDLLPDLTDS